MLPRRRGALVIATLAMPPSVHSSGTTASAPAGTGAPVMIRTRSARADTRVAPAWTGGDVADDRQVHRVSLATAVGDVGDPHGVAVHRGVVEGRQVDVGRHVLGEDAAVGVEQLQVERRERLDAVEDVGQVLRRRSSAPLTGTISSVDEVAKPGA